MKNKLQKVPKENLAHEIKVKSVSIESSFNTIDSCISFIKRDNGFLKETGKENVNNTIRSDLQQCQKNISELEDMISSPVDSAIRKTNQEEYLEQLNKLRESYSLVKNKLQKVPKENLAHEIKAKSVSIKSSFNTIDSCISFIKRDSGLLKETGKENVNNTIRSDLKRCESDIAELERMIEDLCSQTIG